MIRAMTERDVSEASALKQRVFRSVYQGHVSDEHIQEYLDMSSSEQALRARLQDPARRLVVWDDPESGQILGGAILTLKNPVGYLSAVWVDPDYRGRGIGLALAQWREQTARDVGCTRCELHVWDGNPGGIAFALSRGYSDTGERLYDSVTDSNLMLYARAEKASEAA